MSNEYEWYEKASIAFTKLSPKPGDIITVTVPANIDPQQAQMVALYLEEVIQDKLPDSVQVMVVQAGIEMKCLNADEMAKHGWYKLATGDTGTIQ